MSLVQVPPHVHSKCQRLLFPGGTCQQFRGKTRFAPHSGGFTSPSLFSICPFKFVPCSPNVLLTINKKSTTCLQLTLFKHMQTYKATFGKRLFHLHTIPYTLCGFCLRLSSHHPSVFLLSVCVLVAFGKVTTACVLCSNDSVVAHKAINRLG